MHKSAAHSPWLNSKLGAEAKAWCVMETISLGSPGSLVEPLRTNCTRI